MPEVCNLDDRQQVSLGVLFTVVAFHLGLKSMDVYPKVPYIMFIDKFFLLNMFVMALCVMLNGLSYVFHTNCDESKGDVKTRSTFDMILLSLIIAIWGLWNLYISVQVFKPKWYRQLMGLKDGPQLKTVESHMFRNKNNSIRPW